MKPRYKESGKMGKRNKRLKWPGYIGEDGSKSN